ncbi:hypothetical protein TREMEDRAFT_68316 [Tremella mesenterica DSM 1558]|uniref:uncharacterized protein n=1 Tax=Tremella mesenterica (strain ATCC 24925 / CBS 8224 / DSM 1558 / NBRC 9311 / NRRL Y-6157 / RJB 2259-6 / UBC 559-6) TaxID=578456 RepID=UPI0003F49C1A|nr:uncharacterized protein TREMEDRAFT_68316 [Tremella mesenterica DSM 1558]EIW69821.1 hypothetical protein TREMEDRAFT_68316 [Tremella mesenterica DSM 1558]
MTRTALIVVDVQYDFLPHGSLAIPDGDRILSPINKLLDVEEGWDWTIVVASQDYHPPGHISFASTHDAQPFTSRIVTDVHDRTYEQMMWPDHCIVGTHGVEIHEDVNECLRCWKGEKRIACHKCLEAYSAFEGYLLAPESTTSSDTTPDQPVDPPVSSRETELARYLFLNRIQKVVVVGLALDYCVKSTALSSLEAGFPTAVFLPGTAGTSVEGETTAISAVKEKGGVVVIEKELRKWIQ